MLDRNRPQESLPSLTTSLSPLHVKGFKKKRTDFLLEAHFSVQVGERVSLFGRSGSGKTTLLRWIAGFESSERVGGGESQGQLFFDSIEVTNLPAFQRQIGFVFQDQALFFHMNVLENVSFGLKMKGISKEEREALSLEWLEKVDLKKRAQARIGELSGGERQRVAFIRSLIWKPRLLLLDEPFSALDLKLADHLRTELLELHALWPAPMILVSHDPLDQEKMTHRSLEIVWEPGSSERRVKEVKSREKTNDNTRE